MAMPGYSSPPQHASAPIRLAVGCWALALTLAGCKACLLPWTGSTMAHALRWGARLAAITASDVSFVCGLWLLLRGALAMCRRMGAPPGLFWILAGTLLAAATLFGVVNVPVFLSLNVQLSYPLLSLVGTWREFATSVVEATPWTAWLAAVALPGAVLCTMAAVPSRPSRQPPLASAPQPPALRRGGRLPARIGWAVLLCYLATSSWWCRTQWPQRSNWQRRVARSPHAQFLASLVTARSHAWSQLLPEAACAVRRPAQTLRAVTLPHGRPDPAARNVVLLVLESVAAGYLQVYGGPWPNTPRLAELARHSLVFENAYAQCPSSAKALVALVTGTYPRLDLREQTQGSEQLPSLAVLAVRRGYRTAFFHSGNWAWRGGDAFLHNHGFQHFEDARQEQSLDGSWGTRDDWLAERAMRWIDSASQPFLAMLWTIQTHHPYRSVASPQPYAPHDEEFNRYLNAIRDADALVGRVWDGLVERGLAESTLLVVVGDHGEAFGQHQQRLHIFGLYEENVRVPLIIIHGGRLPSGRVRQVCQQIDVAPTVAWCLGLPADPRWQGHSLLAQTQRVQAIFYTLWDPIVLGTRRGRYKYLWHAGGEEELFDVATDPRELRNLAGEQPALAQQLRQDVARFVASQQQCHAEQASNHPVR